MPLTPRPEIDALLSELLAGVQSKLGRHFVGMSLFGSLAAGDFDDASDVDVLVVTDADISDDVFLVLQAMHDRLAQRDSPWAPLWRMQLEVSYIPVAALRRYDPAHNCHPHLDRGQGERLHWMVHTEAWIVQRHVLREYGVVIAGPPPASLIDPVSPDDLRRAMLPLLQLRDQFLRDHPDDLSVRGHQSYVVLSACRMLYTWQHGAVVSKPTAARWALATWDKRWHGLIERALEGRHMPDTPALPEDINQTLELIRVTLDGRVPYSTTKNDPI